MRQTERGLMLLCLPLGDTLAGALSLAQARELSKRARAIGIGEDDPLREVTQKDVQRLGYSEAVSYTHLEVYKRQTPTLPSPPAVCRV